MMALKTWTNPGPYPHVAQWVIGQRGWDTETRFILKCLVCYEVFSERGWSWTPPTGGPTLGEVVSALARDRANAPAAEDTCPGPPS